jgi:hypothetical protein
LRKLEEEKKIFLQSKGSVSKIVIVKGERILLIPILYREKKDLKEKKFEKK